MNYKPFLTRDFKSIGLEEAKKPTQWNKLHWLVVAAAIMSVTTLLVFASKDVSAKRSETITSGQMLSNNPVAKEPVQPDQMQITLPLSIPGSKESVNLKQNLQNQTHTPKAKMILASTQPAINALTSGPATPDTAIGSEESQPLYAWLDEKVRKGDSLAKLFQRHKLSSRDLYKIMQLGDATSALKSIQAGQVFKFRLDDNQQLLEMVYQQNRFQSLHVKRSNDSFSATTLSRVAQKRKQYLSGNINSSLFVDAQNAGMDASLIMDLVSIFAWDIDFALDLRKGDSFSLLYEEHFLDGLKINDGNILAATFTNQGKTYKAIRYTDPDGNSNYYTPEGLSMRKAFLRTPVDFRRISSRFGNRKHPILNRMRLHKGVDYSAPTGTPVKAAGDGKIIFRGRKGGYGNAIIIRHGGRYSTLYAHLNGFKRGLYNGKLVKQGQTIAYVGSTGRATGPHLHYEFRINGVHRNPLTVKLPNAAPINKTYKEQFKQQATNLLAQLNSFNYSIAANSYNTQF